MNTPKKNLQLVIDEDLRQAVYDCAIFEHSSVSQVVRRALNLYVLTAEARHRDAEVQIITRDRAMRNAKLGIGK